MALVMYCEDCKKSFLANSDNMSVKELGDLKYELTVFCPICHTGQAEVIDEKEGKKRRGKRFLGEFIKYSIQRKCEQNSEEE